MKRSFILIIAGILVNLISGAQPVLTAANTNPVPGDGFYYYTGSVNIPLFMGMAGANQTWTIITTFPSSADNRVFSDASVTPYFSSFPNATLAFHSSDGQYGYFISDPSQYAWLGSADSTTLYLQQHPFIFLQYPFQFADSFYDIHYDTSSTGSGILTTVLTTADSYGTLNLPTGTFTNVLRVRSTTLAIDTALSDTTLDEAITYFYVPGVHAPVFQYVVLRFYFFGTVSEFYSFAYSQQSSVGLSRIADTEDGLSVFPVPAHDRINLKVSNGNYKSLKVEIRDLQGMILKKFSSTNSGTGAGEVIPLNGLVAGIYLLEAIADDKHFIKKIVIE